MIDEDIDASLLERRWFATMTAARAKQAECEVLLEVVAIASASWRNSRVELMNLEALRDALGDRMAEMVSEREEPHELFTEQADAENPFSGAPEASKVWSAA